MNFTQDWFSHNIPTFEHCMTLIPDNKEFLEVGSFEGKSTCWLLQNGLAEDGRITCIDTFEGGEEHEKHGVDFVPVRRRFEDNTQEAKKQGQLVRAIQDTSYRGLAVLAASYRQFDFIYIDGSHSAPDVLTDACMAFGMLKQGGIMLFDDYLWIDMPHILHRPKVSIDTFVNIFSERCNIAVIGHQIAIKRL